MYEQSFNLNARPFTSMHYVKHYFAARAIDESLQTCQLTIERGSGPVVVIGDHGTGKTLLLAMLEEKFSQQFHVVNLSADTIRSREDFLQNMLYQLQLNHRGLSENDMRLDIIDALRKGQVGHVLLLIDNAQKMTTDAFEEIQPLLDFVHEGQPQVRLVLAGSQSVEDRLADNRLVTFNQRIASRCFLSTLGSEETQAYVRAHLVRVGGDPDALFAPEAWRAIYEVTEGRPRFINQVCDHAMIFSATRGVVPITDSLIREAWYDIQRLPGSTAPAGSGASISSAPIVTERIVSGENGDEEWTVLEFGELGEESPAAESPAAESSQDESPTTEAAPVASFPAEEPPAQSNEERDNAAIVASAIAGLGLAGVAASAVANDSPEPAASVSADANDPFNAYDFDNEEVLADAYSPFVAEQNQRSLEVTSEQLQNLTPVDQDQGQTPQHLGSEQPDSFENLTAVESFPTFESAMKPEPVREPVTAEQEPRENVLTRSESEASGFESYSEDFSVQQSAPEAQPGSGYVPLDPDALRSQQAAPPAEPAAPVVEQESDEIRRQAEAIIQNLRAGQTLSPSVAAATAASFQHETNTIEATIDQSLATGPDPSNPASPQVVMPNPEASQQQTHEFAPTNEEHPAALAFQQPEPDVPQMPVAVDVDPDPVEPERRILNDIREQAAFASDSVGPQQDDVESTPVQRDDRDILSVSHEQQSTAAVPTPPAELPAWTEQEPSSGEASRVDYQKLFDQLRNHQNREEG